MFIVKKLIILSSGEGEASGVIKLEDFKGRITCEAKLFGINKNCFTAIKSQGDIVFCDRATNGEFSIDPHFDLNQTLEAVVFENEKIVCSGCNKGQHLRVVQFVEKARQYLLDKNENMSANKMQYNETKTNGNVQESQFINEKDSIYYDNKINQNMNEAQQYGKKDIDKFVDKKENDMNTYKKEVSKDYLEKTNKEKVEKEKAVNENINQRQTDQRKPDQRQTDQRQNESGAKYRQTYANEEKKQEAKKEVYQERNNREDFKDGYQEKTDNASCVNEQRGQMEVENKCNENGNFFDAISEQMQQLFDSYPQDKELELVVPQSRWVRVPTDGRNFYVVGVVFDGDIPQLICYGVPDKNSVNPPECKENARQWLELERGGRGYWMMYQDAKSGATLEAM